MSGSHTDILNWIAQRRLPPEALPNALRAAGIVPGPADWRNFFERLTLWLGVVFCAAAVVFFFAYNWQEIGRYAKFGLVEILIVACIGLCWSLDLDRMAGKAALLGATLFTGALLALVGQVYQTGADTYELFAVWAIAVLPWVVLGAFGALWLVWLALINLAVILYHQTFGGWFGFVFDMEQLCQVLFALNTVALCVWEACAANGVVWLRARWSPRVLAAASGALITILSVWAVVEHRNVGASTLIVYAVWLIAAYVVYRKVVRDTFVLAGGVLSVIIFVAALLSKHLLRHADAGGFLFIGLVVIGLSAAGGLWLKSVAKEAA